jgi:hypothetical protein
MASKFLKVGQIKTNKKFGTKELVLSNLALKKLVEILTEHGKSKLTGLSEDQLKACEFLRYSDEGFIEPLKLSIFDPKEGAPEFVLGDVCIKLG